MNTASKILLVLLPVLGGCASTVPAPVEDRAAAQASMPTTPVATGTAAESRGMYTVKKGDTLYSIALDHGQDYKDIAAWNNLENPNLIKVGQQLRVAPEEGSPVAVAKPVTSSAPVEVKPVAAQSGGAANSSSLKKEPKGGKLAWSEDALARARQGEVAAKPVEARPEVRPVEAKAADKPAEKVAPVGDEVEWMWPVQGKPMAAFADGSKGIDIAGKSGDPVLAAAAGVVSYAGAGLRGYGNLVVLRHNATYLSVYAHNSKLLVKEKDTVARGQKIAEMGSTDAENPRLHFEIRRQGKPADPQKFLPPR
ncbi:peptidoglycan DD-metalloendopeptidase family protein [Sulfuritalea sp.]|uniref:peptidoglycan DD-metalloendopeptidase family protein n=1 Tax=Sulfuritalea sp. TaxID=2480090 RepID=UPI001AC7EAA3|nr:peptidoglycan DD-metalloendopeptidase family protein [Sulfuritalea sp.]MBN8474396.1 peptidoglycan DD-metalloendopeptidase family protein [Sulfuritalea sp.]